MREYGQVQTAFWIDPKCQSMDDDSKLFILYILTSPHTNSLGCFRATLGYIESDLGWDKSKIIETVSKPFVNRFVTVDFGLGWVFVPKFIKWNQPANPNVWKKLFKDFSLVPKKLSFYNELVLSIKKYGQKIPQDFVDVLNGIETVCKPFANKDPDPDPDPDPTRPTKPSCQRNKFPNAKTKEKRKGYSEEFLLFWQAYPNKTGKGAAQESWDKKKPELNDVLVALEWQKRSQKWIDGFVPNPATYLNQKRWDDEKTQPGKVKRTREDLIREYGSA
jgi:hypothetical protein